jgi:hypothetical protein
MLIFNLVPGGAVGFVWAGWTIGVEVVLYALYFRSSTGGSVQLNTESHCCSPACWFGKGSRGPDLFVDSRGLEADVPRLERVPTLSIFASGIVLYQLSRAGPQWMTPAAVRIGDMLIWAGMFGFWALVTIGYG